MVEFIVSHIPTVAEVLVFFIFIAGVLLGRLLGIVETRRNAEKAMRKFNPNQAYGKMACNCYRK